MANIYALLIGINAYPVKPLSGCINDVDALEACLKKLYGNDARDQLHIKRLTDLDGGQPTRENIISAFEFFSSAQAGDECLFYYSGHGSFTPAPTAFQSSTGELQSLVCIDSRLPGGTDLMDKELGYLIWKTTQKQKGIHFTAITDCCHSGTITKSLRNNSQVTERMLSGEDEHSPQQIEDYLGYAQVIDGIRAYSETSRNGQRYIQTQNGTHFHLSASRDYQTAKELPISNGQVQGAFTYNLIQRLYASGGLLSYRKLVDDITISVKNLVADQYPALNTYGNNETINSQRTFLGREAKSSDASFELSYSTANGEGWNINGGSIHGIGPGDEILTQRGVKGRVISSISPERSRVSPNLSFGSTAESYPVTVYRKADEAYLVSVPSGAGLPSSEDFQQALPTGSRISFVQDGTGRFVVQKNEMGEVIFSQLGSSEALFRPFASLHPQQLAVFANYTESVASSLHLRALQGNTVNQRPYTIRLYRSTVPYPEIEADFEEIDPILSSRDLYYKKAGNEYVHPTIRISLTNTGNQRLWMNSAYITVDHAISTTSFHNIEVAPGQTGWLTLNEEDSHPENIGLQIDDQFRQLGYYQITEYIKLFVSPERVDTHLLAQPGVELSSITSKGTDALEFHHRGPISGNRQPQNQQWFTETLGFHIIQPRAEVSIGADEIRIGRLQIAPHSSFRAQADINSSATTQRNADGIPGPGKQQMGSDSHPVDLSGNQRGGEEMDVLELFSPSDTSSINRENPLILSLDAERSMEDHSIIPLGYDAENKCYYPLGFADNNGKILIENLPEPSSTDHTISLRSFMGSIKIYFQKVIGQKIGLSYDYPRLAVATLDKDGEASYESDFLIVSEKVKAASKIVLFIHGIIGDTTGMIKCTQSPLDNNGSTLKSQSDLILAFDYENLNTPIETTAADLKEKLEKVGLGVGHGKSLTIIAHSMGGLVSRSMIERYPGLATSLIMLGTPNNGTPWADVRDLAAALITYAINGAAALKPWLFVLSGVGKLIGGLQHTLKQMDSKTGIYTSLNLGKDPGITYTIIAGNTQLIIPNYEHTSRTISKRIKNALQSGAYKGLDNFLFKLPNDIAVSEESIKNLQGTDSWDTKPVIHIVGENHLSYFTNAKVLSLLDGVMNTKNN